MAVLVCAGRLAQALCIPGPYKIINKEVINSFETENNAIKICVAYT